MNEGKDAILEIRGGKYNNSDTSNTTVYSDTDCAIVNKEGKVSVLEGTREEGAYYNKRARIKGAKIGVLNYNGGSLDLYGGAVHGGDGDGETVSDCAAISTTPFIVKGLTGTEGSVTIVGGTVGNGSTGNIGIAYADTCPVLLGGNVFGVRGAVVKFASSGVLADVETYAFTNAKKENIPAYIPKNGSVPAKALTYIVDGKNQYGSQSISYNATKVGTFAELKNALTMGGNIMLTNDIEVTESISFHGATTLYGNNKKLTVENEGVNFTISENAIVGFVNNIKEAAFIKFDKMASGDAGIINNGTLSMNKVSIEYSSDEAVKGELIRNNGILYYEDCIAGGFVGGVSENSPFIAIHNNGDKSKAYIKGNSYVLDALSGVYGIAIYNEGALELDLNYYSIYDEEYEEYNYYNYIGARSTNGVAIVNKGKTTMKNQTGVVSFGKGSIAVKNQGEFIMEKVRSKQTKEMDRIIFPMR